MKIDSDKIRFSVFHKFFRVADGKTEEEGKQIADVYNAICNCPEWAIKEAFEEMIRVAKDEGD